MAPLGTAVLGACGGGADGEARAEAVNGRASETDITSFPGASSPTASGSVPAWVANLPLWHWYEIPNTALASVDPAVQPLGITGPRSKIEAWCGASLRRKGSVYILGAAGGHGDYAGNEVNALALNTEVPAWVELGGPSPNEVIIDGTQFYLDNRPSATHTYYATQFIDALDRMIVFASPGVHGGFPPAPPGFPYKGSARSYSFNLAKGDWDAPDYIAHYPGEGDFTAALCVKHPWTGDVYYSRNYGAGWYRWTHAKNVWARLSDATRGPWYAGSAIDPTRERMLVVGGYSPASPQVHRLDGARIDARFSGPASSALVLSGYPGVVYDEAADCYLVAYNAKGRVMLLRVGADSWFVDEPPLHGVAPASRLNGILNAIQYVPELKGLVLANTYDGNVWFLKTAT